MGTLVIDSIHAGYGRVKVLDDVSISIEDGQLLTIIGANGAGKTTLLRTLSGLTTRYAGSIRLDGEEITTWSPTRIARAGLVHVAEGRRLFHSMSVADNLELGAYATKMAVGERESVRDSVYELFPILREKRYQEAGRLSGGQQQMLAIGQALVARPKLLLVDELSFGLAPKVLDAVLAVLLKLNKSGLTIVLVEQAVEKALSVADTAVLMQSGRVVAAGTAQSFIGNSIVHRAYLGVDISSQSVLSLGGAS